MPTDSAPAAAPAPAAPALTISQQIAEFAAALTPEAIPAAVRECAKLHVLDVVGTALAATRFDFAQHALAGISNLAEGGNNSVIGMHVKLPLRDAVLLNGILAHGLDYDDTHPGAIVHPTSSAFPCALGVAENRNASGADLLVAYILGVEIATRLGIAAAGTMHTQGFHTTGIAGHFGCAVAAGKLFNLSPRACSTRRALPAARHPRFPNIAPTAPGTSGCIRPGRASAASPPQGWPAAVSSAPGRSTKALTAFSAPTPARASMKSTWRQ